jgi:hypothetical protein
VAVDGKTLRGARRMGATAAHLVPVFAYHARIGAQATRRHREKQTKSPAYESFFDCSGTCGLLVTIDAMHTQMTTGQLSTAR